jgi:hypothetical protein
MQILGSIMAQFPSPHYREEDVRGHRDVRISNPMSDQGMSSWPRNVISPDAQWV